jgi:hypothetical protein
MKKLFIILSFLISLTFLSYQSWALPACPTTEDWNNCYGNYIFDNGDKYEGEWNDNTMHGQGIFASGDIELYEGEFKDGKRHGQGTFTSCGLLRTYITISNPNSSTEGRQLTSS